MLALRTSEHEHFDLSDGASLDVTGSNPAFDPDVVARFFSFPFALPASPRNLRLLSHANRLDASRRSPDTSVELWMGGSPLQEGRLRVSSTTEARLECVFGNRDRELLDRLQAVRIRDLMPALTLDEITVATYAPRGPLDSMFIAGKITITLHGNVPTAIVNPPVGVFLEPPDYDPVENVTTWISEVPLFPENVSMTIHGVQVWENYTGVPGADAGPLFAALLNSVFNGQENVHRYMEAMFAGTGPCGFPIVYHTIYGDSNPEFSNYVNFWRDGAWVYNKPEEERGHWRATFVPYVRHRYIFERIAEHLGLAWDGPAWDIPDFAQAVVWSNYTLDKVEDIIIGGEPKVMNAFSTEFWLGNSLPDWTAADYLKKVCALLNFYIQQRGDTLYLRRRVDQLRTVVPFPHILRDYKLLRKPESGVRLSFPPDENDGSEPIPPYTIGAGGKEITPEIGPLSEREIFYGPGRTWRMCSYIDLGGRAASGDTPSSAAPRIFFDRGEQVDTNDDLYQMSSAIDTDTSGAVIGELSLHWDGDQGLYPILWKGWAELEDKEELEMEAVMPLGDVRRMLRWERPVIRFYHPMGEVTAIVRTVQFNLESTDSELILVKLEMLKI